MTIYKQQVVRINDTGNKGIILRTEKDLFGQSWFIIKINEREYPFRKEEFTCLYLK